MHRQKLKLAFFKRKIRYHEAIVVFF